MDNVEKSVGDTMLVRIIHDVEEYRDWEGR